MVQVQNSSKYNSAFFADEVEFTRRSAAVIVPRMIDLVAPRSVVDVGCGVGGWLATFAQHGVSAVLGIDGDYVDRTQLEIPQDRFLAHNLESPCHIDRRFDLAVSLEVAEHIPDAHADTFVETLTALAPVVLFSAAIPHQMGVGHVNEQWPEYWVEKFAHRGFQVVDCLRAELWNDPRVCFWHAQNCLIFVQRDALALYPHLVAEAERHPMPGLSMVHPQMFLRQAALSAPARFIVGRVWPHLPRVLTSRLTALASRLS